MEGLPSYVTPVTQANCDSCAAGYEWWPCNNDPPLCDCGGLAATTTTTTTSQAVSTTTATSGATSTTVATTTTSINPQTTTSTSTTPVASPTAPSQIVCTAYTQLELEAMGGGSPVSDGVCEKCAPPDEYLFWPCNTNLCKCEAVEPVSVPLTTSSSTTTSTVETSCTPVVEGLPSYVTPVTQANCDSCAAGYEWWPCNNDPPLCDCGGLAATTTTTTTSQAVSTTTATSGATSTTVATTTTSINPQTTTSTSTTPVASPTAPSQIVCTAYTQLELEAMGGGSPVSDGVCEKCAPPDEYLFWPCNTNLCKCEAVEPVSAPITTTSTSTSSTMVSSTTGNALMPTTKPTKNPTHMPVLPTTSSPTESGFVQLVKNAETTQKVYEALEQVKDIVDLELFLYETPLGKWEESSVYRFSGLKGGLEVMHEVGVADSYIYLGDGSDTGHIIGLVNVAAFLAQSMVSP